MNLNQVLERVTQRMKDSPKEEKLFKRTPTSSVEGTPLPSIRGPLILIVVLDQIMRSSALPLIAI